MEFGFEPPKFNEDNYNLWKCRMSIFLEATDYDIPAILENGPHVPVKPINQWSEEDKKLVHLDVKIKHLIAVSLPDNVFQSVMYCSTAKDMWDKLCSIYEGNKYVKQMKAFNLYEQYESFSAKKGETVTDTYNRFHGLLNDLRVVGIENEDLTLVHKFTNALPDHWNNLITCLKMNDSLYKMSLADLYGTLLYHEELKAEKENAMKIASKQATKQGKGVSRYDARDINLKTQVNQARDKDRVSNTYDWFTEYSTSSDVEKRCLGY